MMEDPFFHPASSPGSSSATSSQMARRVFQPNFDVHETKDAYHLEGEVAGVTNKNLDIQFTDAQTLVVKGRIERNYNSHNNDAEETGTTFSTTGSSSASSPAAEKPPKPTVEDEAAAKENENGTLVTRGSQEVKKADRTSGSRVWVSERMSGEFQRSFSFPATIDQEAVKASLKDGILSIVVPKRELKAGKKILVE